MKRNFIALLTMAALSLSAYAQQVPSFPGAEGHGRYTEGGRGGKVIHVTNLNDSGTGSLREAVKGNDKKIIVFDVGGVIALKSVLVIGKNTTIAGQTAPEPGITLRYYTVRPAENNVIRFLRSRRGQERDVNDGADAIWQRETNYMMIDHCSFSWSIDEVASFYDNNNFTLQWCTIAESLVHPGHTKGAHGFGGIWGGKLASFHHNLIAHVANRSPRFCGARYGWEGYTQNKLFSEYQWANALQAEIVDMRNCVVFNCGNGCYGGPGGGYVNMVNNFFRSGQITTSNITTVSIAVDGNSVSGSPFMGMTSRYYISGNRLDNTLSKDWSGVNYDSGIPTKNGVRYTPDPNHYYGADEYTQIDGVDCLPIKLSEQAPAGEVTTHKADKAYDKVLLWAGASLCRDDVDERYATETRNKKATYKGSATSYVENGVTKTCTPQWGRIDLVSDVNGYTEENFGTGARAANFDSDRDGIPDEWETANGLDSNDANDAALKTLDPVKYYSNLEIYLNSLVQNIMQECQDGGDDAVSDYYPAYTREDGTLVEAVNMPAVNPDEPEAATYALSQSTNVGGNTSSTYYFDDGFTITNTKSKSYANGQGNGIKYSAGVQYTINLPEGVSINRMTFTGYDNYAEADSYLGEVAGRSYGASEYVFPKKNPNNVVVAHTIEFSQPLSGKITFTPQGKQVVLAIMLEYRPGSEQPAVTPGDVNGDGKVDIVDVTSTISHILGQTPENFSAKAADVNNDNKVDIVDVTSIIDIILGK